MRKIILLLTINLSITSFLIAQSSTTGGDFLKIGIGPRPLGMGSVFTGIGDDVYTLYWNPAGIGFIRRWEYSLMYNKYFADMYYAAISGVKQFRILGSRKTAVGLGIFYHGMPDWDATKRSNIMADDPEKASASNIMGLISFGQRMDWLTDNLSAGISAKIGYSKLMNYDAWTLATDIGLMYRFNVWNRLLTFGLTAQNIGFQTAFIKEKSPIPLGFRFGTSYRIFACPTHTFLIATDVSKYKLGNFKLGFGAEYWFRRIVGIRGGYNFNQDDLGDISFGASIGFDPFYSGSQIDYSSTNFGNVLDYDYKFAYSIHAVRPEPFRLLAPADKEEFCRYDIIALKWEYSEDPDLCDQVSYRILIDTDETRVDKAATEICIKFETRSNLLFDRITDTTLFQLTEDFKPDNYYWTIIAVDKKGHTQRADEIRCFIKSAPDLIITNIAFLPNKTLPDIDDDLQGTIKLDIMNLGKCKAYDFQIELSDLYYCTRQDNIVKSFQIDSIGPMEVISKYHTWETNEIGKHRFLAVADPDNKIQESNEYNNQDSCLAITIPRGRVLAEKDTLDTKKIEFTYSEIPIVPIVFFDQNSAVVSEDFYVEDPIRPPPMLKVIVDSLKKYQDLKIELDGYVDPFSDTEHEKLAKERAQKVYSILVDSLKAPAERVNIRTVKDITKRRIPRSPDFMINAENRRVEIAYESDNPEQNFRLFGPIITTPFNNPRISDGLAFHATVKAYVDIVCWQLIISDAVDQQVVFRAPFKIDPAGNTYDMHDRIVWTGNDNENNLVALNQSYRYEMKIQDKLGREFYTISKRFYLKCDFVEKQRLQVHLDWFDSTDELLKFDGIRLRQLADSLCKADSLIKSGSLCKSDCLMIKFNGYACDIGTFEYNLDLAYNRANTTRSRFLDTLKQIGGQLSLNNNVKDVPSRDELRKKYGGYPGNFAEPLKYYNPCTLKEYVFPIDNAYGRNLSRRVDIILYREERLKK